MTDLAGHRSPYRLLVLAPNWLGDVVMHTPLLSLLHDQRPQVAAAVGRPVAIHLGVKRAWAELFRDDPRVDELMILDRDSRRPGPWWTWRLTSLLRQGGFDAIILGPPSLRVALAAWLARIPSRSGYRSDGRSLFLNLGLPPVPRGRLHYCQEMINLGCLWLDSLAVKAASTRAEDWPVALPGCDRLEPADLGAGPGFWAVAPGTTYGEAKTWPATRLGDFVELALHKAGVRVVLLGDSAARESARGLRERFAAHWSVDPQDGGSLLDLTGRTDLLGAAAVLKSSAAFIGNDSGLMHLAAALGRPTVGVFGSSNPDWTAPGGRQTLAVVPEGFSCRPCYLKKCNQPEFCLDTVSADQVFAAVSELAGHARTGEGGI
jgi:heptosyltransferase-2